MAFHRKPGVALIALVIGATLSGAANSTAKVVLGDPVAKQFSAAANTFGASVLTDLLRADPAKNVLISPLSLEAALTLLAQGSRGATSTAFESGLGLTDAGLTTATAALAFRHLSADLAVADTHNQQQGAPVFAMANGIWFAKGEHLNEAFTDTANENFGAHAEESDFADPQTLMAINKFVSDATKGKIPTLLSSLEPASKVVLVNALYFKAAWLDRFDPAKTKLEPFFQSGRQSINVATMHRQGELRYAETKDFRAVSLPYKDQRLEMVILLPIKEQVANAEILKELDGVYFTERAGAISLPKFTLTFSADLLPLLNKSKLSNALVGDGTHPPDFSGISSQSLSVGSIIHKSVLEVDEEGSEGAAATEVGMARSAAVPLPLVEFKVDRPFYLVIRDRITGIQIFSGRVFNPEFVAKSDGSAIK